MKRNKSFFLVLPLAAMFLFFSCKKDAEEVIDCLFEAGHFDFTHEVDGQDTKTVHFKIEYAGDKNLDNSIKWDFGDGQVQTLNGTTQDHTYDASGSYTVKAEVTLRNGDAYCTTQITEKVNIE